MSTEGKFHRALHLAMQAYQDEPVKRRPLPAPPDDSAYAHKRTRRMTKRAKWPGDDSGRFHFQRGALE